MYHHILVAIDGSRASARGLNEAIRLATHLGAGLRVIHVINELTLVNATEGIAYSPELIDALRKAGHAVLTDAEQRVQAAHLPVHAELVEAHGQAAGQAIVTDALSHHADLVVLGTHGRRGLARLVLGSDAEYVVRHLSIPVLLVRQPVS